VTSPSHVVSRRYAYERGDTTPTEDTVPLRVSSVNRMSFCNKHQQASIVLSQTKA